MAVNLETTTLPATARREIEELSPIVLRAQELQVRTPGDYEAMAEIHARAKAGIKRVNELCAPVVLATDRAHKAATKQRADLRAPLERAAEISDRKMGEWRIEQRRIEQAAERLREEQARAAAAVTQSTADAERLELAEKFEELGDTATRDAILEHVGAPPPVGTAPPSVVPPVVSAIPKIAGQTIRRYIIPRVVSLDLLIESAGANRQFRPYLQVNETALRKFGEATDGKGLVPGVEFDVKEGVTQR